MFYVYILESEKNGRWYYGNTTDLERRISEHNSGQTKSTKGKGPWTLIFVKSFEDKSSAVRFELYLKKIRNKNFIRSEYAKYFL